MQICEHCGGQTQPHEPTVLVYKFYYTPKGIREITAQMRVCGRCYNKGVPGWEKLSDHPQGKRIRRRHPGRPAAITSEVRE